MKLQVQKKMERTILKHYTQLYQLLFGIKSQLRKAIVFVSRVFSVLRNWNFCKGLWTYFLHFHAFLLCNYFFYLMHTDVRLLFPCSYFLFISTVSWYGHFTYISHMHTHKKKKKTCHYHCHFSTIAFLSGATFYVGCFYVTLLIMNV